MPPRTIKNKVLYDFNALDNLETRSFDIKINRQKTPIFIIKKADTIFAYQNICPHAQAPLEWNPNEFLDENKKHIICSLHGAIFSIETGECLGGPCQGQGLTSIDVDVIDENVVVFPDRKE